MADIKAHEFDGFLKQRAKTYRAFLVYGPDRGLVSERATALAALSGVSRDDAFSFLRLEAGEINSDPGRLFDEVNSQGLFGGDKLIWIKGAGADKALSEALGVLLKDMPSTVWLIIEAGDLKKGANLRKVVEADRAAMAIPCYADDGRALNAMVDQELAEAGLSMTQDARALLLSSLGGDRLASRNEVQKLMLYARGFDVIEEHHVAEIVGDASAISTDEAVDAILKGDKQGFLHAVQKVTASKTPIFLVLQSCLRQFQMLDQMRTEMDERGMSASDALNALGRHLHFKRKPVIEGALRQWKAPALAREMNRLQSAVLQSRKRASLEDSIALHTLLATTLQSGRKGR